MVFFLFNKQWSGGDEFLGPVLLYFRAVVNFLNFFRHFPYFLVIFESMFL